MSTWAPPCCRTWPRAPRVRRREPKPAQRARAGTPAAATFDEAARPPRSWRRVRRPRSGSAGGVPALARTRRASRLRTTRPQHPLDLFQEHVGLEVHAVAGLPLPERRLPQGARDERHREARAATGEDGQADAVDGDRALLDQVGGEGARAAEAVEEPVAVAGDPLQASDAVDVALDDVAAHAVAHAERALEVDARPGGQLAEGGSPERLG